MRRGDWKTLKKKNCFLIMSMLEDKVGWLYTSVDKILDNLLFM